LGKGSTFTEQIANTQLNELDILLVVDNSPSMKDKQQLLKKAVPQFVKSLLKPLCVDSAGNTSENPGRCPEGTSEEFHPLDSVHIGVISSSLGGHGSAACPRDAEGKNYDDQAHLIPTIRGDAPDPDGTGFLEWHYDDLSGLPKLIEALEGQIDAVGTQGCEYEAPLEAMHRFLVDPAPPLRIVMDESGRSGPERDAEGNVLVDEVLLAQREAFLRPEGLVSIVVLSDENDCSVMDGGEYYKNAGFGHLVTDTDFLMPAATSACEVNPNDECCFSCSQVASAPDGCDVSACEQAPAPAPEDNRDSMRCFKMKERFGVDLLYPTKRYVDALTKSEIVDAHTGEIVDNALLRGAGKNQGHPRDPGLIFFTGIVGVPWQSLATDDSLANPGVMEYRTAVELGLKDVDVGGTMVHRWDVLLGQPGLASSSIECEEEAPGCGLAPTGPLDPFMIESIGPRPEGLANPISADVTVSASSNNPQANAINGHEANHGVVDLEKYPDGGPANDDLQYACIYPLEEPILDCDPADAECNCGDEPSRNRSICQAPGSATGAQNSQYYARAYPGTRILQVMRDFGANSVPASICPKIATGSNVADPNFGLNPAVRAITDRIGPAYDIGGKCLPRPLTVDDSGRVNCAVVEAAPAASEGGTSLDCADAGRSPVTEGVRSSILRQIEAAGRCGGNSQISCSEYQMCSIDQLVDDPGRKECLSGEGDSDWIAPGFCYIDPSAQNAEGEYVAGGNEEGFNPYVHRCPSSERRLLRFTGEDTPKPNTITMIGCEQYVFSSSDEISPQPNWPVAPFPISPDFEHPEIPAPPGPVGVGR
jgi:hypothetical protein